MDKGLLAAVAKHVRVLRDQGLATPRPEHVMRASDGTIVEIFEWASERAIEQAHSNPAVLALWAEFGAVCDIVPLNGLGECQQLFAGFETLAP
jgi:hypothetical protein